MLESFFHLFVDISIGLTKVTASLGMAKDDIFHTGINQHVRRDLSGVCTFLLEVHVLSTNLDVAAFDSLNNRYDIDSRYAEYYVCILGSYQRFQGLNQSNCLTRSHIHFPVACDNFLSCHD